MRGGSCFERAERRRCGRWVGQRKGDGVVGSRVRKQARDVAATDTSAPERVAELERKIGQQQLELDFFRQALRRVREARRPNAGPGVTGSTRSSKR